MTLSKDDVILVVKALEAYGDVSRDLINIFIEEVEKIELAETAYKLEHGCDGCTL